MQMKFILPLIFSCPFMVSCNKTDDTSAANTTGTPGTGWVVSLMSEPGEVKTAHYNGYQFSFNADGTMTAVGNNQTVTGTWQQFQNDGVTKFGIVLNTQDKNLSDLNDSWVLVSRSNTLISLKDDHQSGNEQLQFSR